VNPTAAASGAVDPIDALLADFVAGNLGAALHALVAAHLAISPRHRRFVADLEAAAVERLTAGESALPRREAVLAAILDGSAAPDRPELRCETMPAPLAAFVGCRFAEVPWRRLLPGIRRHAVSNEGGLEACLYEVRPGGAMPVHSHVGTEVTLVLGGGYSDVTGHYRRGDVAVVDGGIAHRPLADDDEDCIAFIVQDAPLRMTGPILGRLQRLFGG
jgi:putative transcriptional regulator